MAVHGLTMNEFTFSVASAMIDGKCYAVRLHAQQLQQRCGCRFVSTGHGVRPCMGWDNQHVILVLSGIGLVTLLVSVWLFYRKKRKTTEKKRACTAECRAAIVDAVNYHVKSKYRLAKAAGLFPWLIFSGAGGSVGKMAFPGGENGDAGTLLLSRVPVYLPGERPMNRSAMSRQWRNRPGKRWERSLRFLSIRSNLPAFTAWRRKKGLLSAAPLPT